MTCNIIRLCLLLCMPAVLLATGEEEGRAGRRRKKEEGSHLVACEMRRLSCMGWRISLGRGRGREPSILPSLFLLAYLCGSGRNMPQKWPLGGNLEILSYCPSLWERAAGHACRYLWQRA